MPNWVWIALLVTALIAVACLGGGKPTPCCERHTAFRTDVVEMSYCPTRGY